MAKAKDAFRTISEVSEWLDTPTHVLRFWESKFSQIKPVKGAGSRRYYRPADMELLAGIKRLLHHDGMTIRGAQKLLREQGVKHVCALGRGMPEDVAEQDTGAALPENTQAAAPPPAPEAAPLLIDTIPPEIRFAAPAPEPVAAEPPPADPVAAPPEAPETMPEPEIDLSRFVFPEKFPHQPVASFGILAGATLRDAQDRPTLASAVAQLEALRARMGDA